MFDAPNCICYFYNRATFDQIERLDKTMRHFNILSSHSKILEETILRLDDYVKANHIGKPSDKASKTLFQIHKYYASL